MEYNSFPLEFQLTDGKDALQTAQKYIHAVSAISIQCNQLATSVRNGDIVGNGYINFVTALYLSSIDFIFGMVLV